MTYSLTSSSESFAPFWRTTNAFSRCPNFSSSTPTAAASWIDLCEPSSSSTSAGNTFSPPGHDHLVVAPVDVQASLGVEVADVAGGHQALDHVLVAAAGVPLELRHVPDEDPAALALADLLAVLVEQLDDRAAHDLADAARLLAQILRRGDRRVRDLGRPVQVVDHRPEQRRSRAWRDPRRAPSR